MDEPERWLCREPATHLIIATSAYFQAMYTKYGPWSQEEIDASEGHLAWPTFSILLCARHADIYLAPEPHDPDPLLDIYVEIFNQPPDPPAHQGQPINHTINPS